MVLPLTEEELNGTPNRECPSFGTYSLTIVVGLAVKEISSYKIEKKREPLNLPNPKPLELDRCGMDCSNKR